MPHIHDAVVVLLKGTAVTTPYKSDRRSVQETYYKAINILTYTLVAVGVDIICCVTHFLDTAAQLVLVGNFEFQTATRHA
jgi:hypothetical protein